jgi:cell division transport system permease protein
MITGAEALERFGNMFEDGDSLYSGIDASTMRNQYEITLKDNDLIAQTKNEIENIPGVVRVDANVEQANAMATVRNVLYVAALAITGVLLIVSLVIISNTIKLAMMDRREEIAIMKMCGATNSFVRWPFIVEGLILGLVGAMVAFFCLWAVYAVVENALATYGAETFLTILPFKSVVGTVIKWFAGAGCLIGAGGSALAIRKFLQV